METFNRVSNTYKINFYKGGVKSKPYKITRQKFELQRKRRRHRSEDYCDSYDPKYIQYHKNSIRNQDNVNKIKIEKEILEGNSKIMRRLHQIKGMYNR